MKMSDMARSMAAGGYVAAGGGSPMDTLPDQGMPQPAGPTPIEGITQAVSMIEGSLEGLDPDTAKQIRVHVNAIQDLVNGAQTDGQGMDSGAIAPPAPADQGMGAMGGKTQEVK